MNVVPQVCPGIRHSETCNVTQCLFMFMRSVFMAEPHIALATPKKMRFHQGFSGYQKNRICGQNQEDLEYDSESTLWIDKNSGKSKRSTLWVRNALFWFTQKDLRDTSCKLTQSRATHFMFVLTFPLLSRNIQAVSKLSVDKYPT